jgi:hypothetical protein
MSQLRDASAARASRPVILEGVAAEGDRAVLQGSAPRPRQPGHHGGQVVRRREAVADEEDAERLGFGARTAARRQRGDCDRCDNDDAEPGSLRWKEHRDRYAAA